MKTEIHPTYYPAAEVVCGCGNKFKVGATKASIKIEICSKCHPFYTGKQELIDTAGRAQKFHARKAKAASKPKTQKKTRVKKQSKK